LAPADQAAGVIDSLKLLKRLGRPHEFRTTVVAPFVDIGLIEAIAREASGEASLFLQVFRDGRILNPGFMKDYPDQPDAQALLAYRAVARRYLPCLIRGQL
jgi:hypothetical protein